MRSICYDVVGELAGWAAEYSRAQPHVCHFLKFLFANMSVNNIKERDAQHARAQGAGGTTPVNLSKGKSPIDMNDRNCLLRFCITVFMEMFPVGVINSSVSAGLFAKKEFLPATSSYII